MKKHILTIIQLLITVALLWWIFRNPDQNKKLLAALDTANLWWFLPGLVAIGLALLIQVERWLILLRVQGIVVSFSRALRIVLVGMFFNLFLIGATGGDIVKIFLILREAPQKKAGALLSVFIDRIVGLLALAAISAAMIFFHWDTLISHEFTKWVVVAVAIILGGSSSLHGWWIASISRPVFLNGFRRAPKSPRRPPPLRNMRAQENPSLMHSFSLYRHTSSSFLPFISELRHSVLILSYLIFFAYRRLFLPSPLFRSAWVELGFARPCLSKF